MIHAHFRLGAWLAVSLLIGCGGKVADGGGDASTPAPTTTSTSTPTSSPTGSTTSVPPSRPDAGPDVAPPTPTTVDCSGLAVSGSPKGCGERGDVCASEPYPGWAEQMLACLVDKCLAEGGRPPWCGTISLGIGSDGCTNAYEESPGASGCVKYQGYFRRWPCAIGRTITVHRFCGE